MRKFLLALLFTLALPFATLAQNEAVPGQVVGVESYYGTTIVLRRSLIDGWLAEHPDWREVSRVRIDRKFSNVTVECRP